MAVVRDLRGSCFNSDDLAAGAHSKRDVYRGGAAGNNLGIADSGTEAFFLRFDFVVAGIAATPVRCRDPVHSR